MSQSTVSKLCRDSSQREGERKEEWNRQKGPDPHLNLPQVKQIS